MYAFIPNETSSKGCPGITLSETFHLGPRASIEDSIAQQLSLLVCTVHWACKQKKLRLCNQRANPALKTPGGHLSS